MAGKKKTKGQKASTKAAFDEAALSKLTAKIDTELSKPKPKDQKQKDERSGKRKRNDNDGKDANPNKRQAQEAKHGSSKSKTAPKDKKAQLLEEIKLLGGDEADLELVAGLDSDAEETGAEGKQGKPTTSTDMDKALQKELAKFAAGLGFDKVQHDDGATDDELEQEPQSQANGDGEWEDAPEEEDDEVEEEESSEDEEEAQPAEKSQGRSAAGKLVSFAPLLPTQ